MAGTPQVPRPSWNKYFMQLAEVVATRSPYRKTTVGCIIVSEDNRIVSSGYNGYFAGAPHVAIIEDGHEQSTVHAEANAICYSARHSTEKLDGCSIYITHYPCLNCFKMIVSAGITKIFYKHDKNNNSLIDQLKDSYVVIEKIN